MKILVLLLVLCIKNLRAQDEEGVLCSVKFCPSFLNDNDCRPFPENCKIQNSTHNGLILPSPDPCNCCQYCLKNQKEGEPCAVGEDGGGIPDTICGPGLTCTSDQICAKMEEIRLTLCTIAQGEYDDRRKLGTSGTLEERPNCDASGDYEPYKCVLGQSCFCVDRNGERIFGEIPYTSTANLIMKCECSRKYKDALRLFGRDALYPNQHFRCAENGDYDTIQCIGNNCMCTDALDGAPTFPTFSTINISTIAKNTIGDCFKKDIHLEGKYYYECAERYLEILNEISEYKKVGYDTVFEIEFPTCSPDGKYAAIQKDVTTENEYYCANSDGTPIGDYRGLNSAEEPMDCKCARTSLLLPANAFEKPECCKNGNFNRVQCRRGTCYCVDSDGYQDVNNLANARPIEAPAAAKDTLFCYDPTYEASCLGTSV